MEEFMGGPYVGGCIGATGGPYEGGGPYDGGCSEAETAAAARPKAATAKRILTVSGILWFWRGWVSDNECGGGG